MAKKLSYKEWLEQKHKNARSEYDKIKYRRALEVLKWNDNKVSNIGNFIERQLSKARGTKKRKLQRADVSLKEYVSAPIKKDVSFEKKYGGTPAALGIRAAKLDAYRGKNKRKK